MRHRKNFVHYLILAFVAVAVIVYITPIYWILATSLKGFSDITTKLPKFVFEVSFENYQKLMPSEGVPGVTYLFLGEVFVGLLLFGFFSLFNVRLSRALSLRNLGLIWNSIFVLTCLYSFLMLPTAAESSPDGCPFQLSATHRLHNYSLSPDCPVAEDWGTGIANSKKTTTYLCVAKHFWNSSDLRCLGERWIQVFLPASQ